MMIPSDWNIASVDSICEKVSVGIVIKPAQYYVEAESGIRAFRSANVQEGCVKNSDWAYISHDGHLANKKSELKCNDVVIVRSGAPGTSCVITKKHEGYNCIDLVIARPNIRIVLPDYLAYFNNSDLGKKQISNLKGGLAQKHLNVGAYKKITIPLPQIKEQKQIVEILSTWDRAIQKTEALIAAKEKRKKALMQQLLTGKRRFVEFAGQEWHTAPLGKLFAEVKRVVGNREIPPYSITAGVGLVSQKEKWGKDIAGRQYSKYTLLKPGEFSYNKRNSKKYACGCAYLSRELGEICVPNVFISFRPRKESVCVEFYQQWFIADDHARELKRYITSGARSDGLLNLNKNDFFKIKVPYPSFKEQDAIAATLLAADREVETLKAKMAALKAQKRGLMQQLLTGKTRVKLDA